MSKTFYLNLLTIKDAIKALTIAMEHNTYSKLIFAKLTQCHSCFDALKLKNLRQENKF